MKIAPLGELIRLPELARGALNLRAGDAVSLSVIKELSPGLWAVGLKGLVFRARSALALEAGETYGAVVMKGARGLELKLAAPDRAAAAPIVRSDGLPADPLSLIVIESLMKHSVRLDPKMVLGYRNVLARIKGDPVRQGRLLAWLAARGLTPEYDALAELVALAGYGEERDETGRRGHRHDRPGGRKDRPADHREAVRECLRAEKDGAPGPLALVNHLPSASGSIDWIIVPYAVKVERLPLAGTIRLGCDRLSRSVKNAVIIANTEDGRRHQFSLQKHDAGWRLAVTSDDPRWRGVPLERLAESLASLFALGVGVDEKSPRIGGDAQNDGFGPAGGAFAYGGIDTEG